ncbi:aminopeptidase N [Alteromonas lipolytica]|uniref:Aminopeptidase N n=1 Tax=Alteromonas lipolytica TaxID=1856405 RepID=A0A1E8FGT7_9ALTE|nr:aminopeptidase N [Alteromonas lipolytica]OFI35155.1 aminopeptidase N [Alteromonas lipolytica]GGF57196.1 aminopeptidase N [Alteromonas lipolytica]
MTLVAKRREDYRAPDFTITDIALDFTLDPAATRVVSELKVQRQGDACAPLELDGEHLQLLEVAIDGQPVTDYQQTDSGLTLSSVPDSFSLRIVTEINPGENKALEGLYLSNGVYCTQCEAEGFRRITYYLDRPDVLARFTVKITGDKASLPTMLANGNPVDKGTNEDGSHWIQWQDPFPKPSYLFALVAGSFDQLSDTFVTQGGKTVALELFVDKGKRQRGVFALDALKRSMKWDEEVFGLEYDLDIYMIVAVDFFNMGAMENKGLNVFNSKFVLADQASATDEDFFNVESVIAHEYFHNWTGNRVTCRDWFQLSLKEGLTVFRDQQFSSDMSSPLSNRIKQVRVMREHQFAEDASAMSHPIRPDEVIEMNNFYTVTVYDKGAEVIRMMHTLLGVDGFRAGMDEYFRRHDGQAVTCDDFVSAMQSATDIDLTHFSRWYSQSGTPRLAVKRSFDEASEVLTVTITQQNLPTAEQSDKQDLFIPLQIEFLDADGQHVLPDNGMYRDNLVIVDKAEMTLTFTGKGQAVTPVALGNFSAPVKLTSDLTPSEWLHAFRFANDAFSRWDAIQQLYDWCIEQYYRGAPHQVDNTIWQGLYQAVEASQDNPEILGECLVIPSFETLCQSRDNIDVHGLNKARQAFSHDLAKFMQDLLLIIYQTNQTDSYAYEPEQVSSRRCKNVVLGLLAELPLAETFITEQFNGSDNMSDTLGALKAAQVFDLVLFNNLMNAFEQRWRDDPLVLDKWFGLHATCERSDILAQLTLLRQHPQFSQQNPNRVRAVIGSFAFYNTAGFHADDGSGYRFLTDYLFELDKSNPQVASRLVTPLTQWQHYASDRQALMKQQLARLLDDASLSKDLYEKVSKALAYGHDS